MLFIGNWHVRHHQPTFNLAPSRPKSWIFLCATGVVEVGDTGDRISFTLTVAWRLYPQIASQPMATPDIKFRRVPWIPCVSALDIVDEFPIEDWISLLRASIFLWWGGNWGSCYLAPYNPKLQRDDLMHPGTTAESPRASDKAFSCCRLFWGRLMSDDGRWHVMKLDCLTRGKLPLGVDFWNMHPRVFWGRSKFVGWGLVKLLAIYSEAIPELHL